MKLDPNAAPEPSCHCHHVVVIETKIGIATWMIAACIVAVLGTAGTLIGSFVSRRVSWRPPPTPSERLFLDRINKTDSP